MLQRLASSLGAALKRGVDLVREIADQHVHACKTLAHRVGRSGPVSVDRARLTWGATLMCLPDLFDRGAGGGTEDFAACDLGGRGHPTYVGIRGTAS